jgi:hypothetical protein
MKEIERYRIKAKTKPFLCKRCRTRFTDENTLIHHRIDMHGEYPEKSHVEYPNDSLVNSIYIKYYSGKSGTKKSTPFNPEEVYRNLTLDDNNTIILGKLDCVKFDDKDRKIPLNRQIDILYIYDPKQHRCRLYTYETKYGDFKEIAYSKKTGTFVIKGIDRLRRKWDKEHGVSRVDVVGNMLTL